MVDHGECVTIQSRSHKTLQRTAAPPKTLLSEESTKQLKNDSTLPLFNGRSASFRALDDAFAVRRTAPQNSTQYHYQASAPVSWWVAHRSMLTLTEATRRRPPYSLAHDCGRSYFSLTCSRALTVVCFVCDSYCFLRGKDGRWKGRSLAPVQRLLTFFWRQGRTR